MYFCVEVRPSCAASSWRIVGARLCFSKQRAMAFPISSYRPVASAITLGPAPLSAIPSKSRHARQREHLGQSRNQRLAGVLMQAILHRVPQQIVAAIFERGDE